MKGLRLALGILLCLSAARVPAAAETAAAVAPEARFQEALKAYEARDFARACEGWQALVDEGHGGTALYYDLGNAWYRRGDAGRAVLNWERALLLDPLDRDTRANLGLVRAGLADRFDATARLPLWDALDGLLASLPAGPLAWGGLFFGLGAALVAAGRYLRPERRLSTTGRLLFTILLAPALLAVALLLLQDRRLGHQPRGVILATKVEVRAAPSPGATAQFDLHTGTAVVLRREAEGGWREIEVPDGRSGWVPPGSLEALRLPLAAELRAP